MATGIKTGGRQKGTPNKATAELKVAAQRYTTKALKTLASIMEESESDQARVAAANSILDRGYGKPKQAVVGGDEDDAPIELVTKIVLCGPDDDDEA